MKKFDMTYTNKIKRSEIASYYMDVAQEAAEKAVEAAAAARAAAIKAAGTVWYYENHNPWRGGLVVDHEIDQGWCDCCNSPEWLLVYHGEVNNAVDECQDSILYWLENQNTWPTKRHYK